MKLTPSHIFTLVFFFSHLSFAFESPVRAPEQDWTEAAKQVWQQNATTDPQGFSVRQTATRLAVPYTPQINASILPEWTGTYSELQNMFIKARDQRLYMQSNRPGFPRRATWLYPVDGCYARAAHVARVFEADGEGRPGKVFAFGNLRMNTQFDRAGSVYWWYHVAAAFRVGANVVVLDPSADPYRPLLLSDWLSKIAHSPLKTRIAFCDTRAYMPSMTCIGGSESQERAAVGHQKWLLSKEWARVANMGMNPESLLGDNPPWKVQFPWSENSIH